MKLKFSGVQSTQSQSSYIYQSWWPVRVLGRLLGRHAEATTLFHSSRSSMKD